MELLTACQRVAQFSQLDLDLFVGEKSVPANTAANDADLRMLVNWGVKAVALRIRPYDPQISFAITAGTGRYSLQNLTVVGKRVIRPFRIYQRNGHGYLKNSNGEPGMYTATQMQNDFPGWQDQAAGNSSRAIFLGRASAEVILWPTPDAGYITTFGGVTPQLYIEGECLPNDLATDGTDDTDELPIPYELHEAACFCAAIKGRMPMATEASAWNSLRAFNSEFEEIAGQIARDQANDMVGPGDEHRASIGYIHHY